MAAPSFRPGLTPLEDRTTPAVSPEQVFGALSEAAQTHALMVRASAKPPQFVNAYTKAFLNQYLPTLTVQSQQSAAVLAEYQNDLVALAAENPAVLPYVGRVSQARYTAQVNAFTGGILTTAFGGIPIRTVAPTPPVLTAVPIPQVFDKRQPGDPAPVATDFTSAANLTNTIPPLDSPFFQPVGNQGLRIEDVVQGVGTALTGQETSVPVLYAGFLAADGSKFDEARAAPATFNLANGVIAGFQQGLVGLKPGGVRNIDIPPELGYGAAGSGTAIPPNSRLVFQVKYAQQPLTQNGTGTGTGTSTGGFSGIPIVGGNNGGTGTTGTGTVGTGGGTLGSGGTVGGTGTPGGIGGTLGSGGNVGTGGGTTGTGGIGTGTGGTGTTGTGGTGTGGSFGGGTGGTGTGTGGSFGGGTGGTGTTGTGGTTNGTTSVTGGGLTGTGSTGGTGISGS